jgi:hypothetical protein
LISNLKLLRKFKVLRLNNPLKLIIICITFIFFYPIQNSLAQITNFKYIKPESNITWQEKNAQSNAESQAEREDSGSPSFRRSPREGEEKFEPRRIPLRIPLQKLYRSSPGITIMNPSGYGASWKSAGIGIGLQERVRFRNDSDGVFGLGFGLGNPQKNLGLQIGIGFVDLSNPFKDGVVNFKLHRRLPKDMSLALGTQGAVTWGDTDGGSSVYGVLTKRFVLKEDRTKPFSELYTSLGVGGGQFRSESDIDNGVESVGVFGSMSLRFVQPASLVTEWTGQDLTIGVSFVPFRSLPLAIVPALTDITGSAGDGARFIFGLGYSFSF